MKRGSFLWFFIILIIIGVVCGFSRKVVYILVPSFRCLCPDGFNFLVVPCLVKNS